MISRVGLSLWHFERVVEAQGWYEILLSGLRVDIASISYLLILPALLASLISGEHFVGRIWNWVLRIWITAGIWFVVYMEAVTPPFIMEYDLRPNRLFVEYLIYPKEVFGMLWSGYKFELFSCVIITFVALLYGWKWSKRITANIHYPRWYWRPVTAVFLVSLCLIGARSTFDHRPLNPAMVAFSTDPLINDLALNSSYSMLFAAKQMGSEASAFKFYPPMDKKDIIAQVQSSMNVVPSVFLDPSKPTLVNHNAMFTGRHKNIVILLMESHGARYVKSLGGRDLSPNIDKLMKEGWAFTRMYASGTRSVRGIEAVTTGFSPTPARSVVKLGKSQTNFFTVADLLKERKYHTQFIYGGESHFDNMKSFFLGNGFVDMQDFPTFVSPKFVGSWGASDQDLFSKADEQFALFSAQKQPFFSLVFTSSNHSPFEYPDGVIEPNDGPKQSVENAVKYADHALGEFIEKAKKSTYWNDTVFAVIADHDARTFGSLPVPIGHFRIPAVIFGGGIEAQLDTRLVSQIDLVPTLLSLAGIESRNPMIGHDLTKVVPKEKQRAIMQRDKNFAWMTQDNQVVVIQPEKGISTYLYNPKEDSLIAAPVKEDVVSKAHANAMWGNLAFENNYYTAQQSYFISQ
uniref:LTA synthase family protein n=2 Tax=Vibrio ziniensis TaxID=2711221 RepID=A0A6G7CQY2_9VIBR|nr:LTA synthase family protein [Vibrio ziniensis]